jgi:hypothetical protein
VAGRSDTSYHWYLIIPSASVRKAFATPKGIGAFRGTIKKALGGHQVPIFLCERVRPYAASKSGDVDGWASLHGVYG